jgi:hypothetical protein
METDRAQRLGECSEVDEVNSITKLDRGGAHRVLKYCSTPDLSSFQSLDAHNAAPPSLRAAHCAQLHGRDSMHRDLECENVSNGRGVGHF